MSTMEERSVIRDQATALPMVSVIIPTFNRAITLADTLAGLIAQDYPADRLEVIVVDNDSTDATERVVQTAAAAAPIPIAYYRKENRGPAAARNYGIARSGGELLAFTDSDCIAGRDWLRRAVGHMAPNVGLVAGPVRPFVNPRRIPSFFYHQTDHSRPNELYVTANILYRRSALERVGGFDEQFGAYAWGAPIGGEDTDLGWRVRQAGYRAVWAGDAPVDHEASNLSIRAWLLEPVRARIVPFMVSRLPGLRGSLHWRYFTGPENPLFYLGLVGLLVAACTRRPPALLLSLPWLWQLRSMVDRDRWPPSRWWRIPVKYGLSAVRAATVSGILIASSLRNRTVVL